MCRRTIKRHTHPTAQGHLYACVLWVTRSLLLNHHGIGNVSSLMSRDGRAFSFKLQAWRQLKTDQRMSVSWYIIAIFFGLCPALNTNCRTVDGTSSCAGGHAAYSLAGRPATPDIFLVFGGLSSATWPAEPMAQYGVGQTPAPAFAAATPPQYGESVVSHPLLSPDLIRLLQRLLVPCLQNTLRPL